MRKYIMLLIAISIGNYTFGQISFKKDYNFIDSITKNLNSYNIVVMINDSNISFPNAITEDLIKTFVFLKHKKRTALNPDFTIQVLINTILLEEPQYSYIGKEERGTPYEYNVYEISSHYYFNPIVQLFVKQKVEYTVALNSNKVVESSFKHFENTNPTNNVNWAENSIDHRIKMYTANFKKLNRLFINNFSELIKNYKKSK